MQQQSCLCVLLSLICIDNNTVIFQEGGISRSIGQQYHHNDASVNV